MSKGAVPVPRKPGVPEYLERTYWWAYLHPTGVRLFERQWLTNLILFGHYGCLRDAALREICRKDCGRTLQVACVYGDLTQKLAQCHGNKGNLEVVDVAPIQLANLRRKLAKNSKVTLHRGDSSALSLPDGHYDRVLLFFLLHEQPEDVRERTLSEALRVTRPGGQVVIVDYHKPVTWSPLRYLLVPVLKTLEPYAMDLWRWQIRRWLPVDLPKESFEKRTWFGGLYQKLVITVPGALSM